MGAGEHFILGFSGTTLPPWVAAFAREFGLGGVILFDRDVASGLPSRNIESRDQVKSLCASIHALPSRPLTFVDQEGGAVRRLKPERGFVDLPSHERLATLGRQELLTVLRGSFSELREIGIDFNLAPVVDLNINPDNPNIGRLGRSVSADPSIVRAIAGTMSKVAAEVGLQLCIKHYPGLGGAATDSHTDATEITPSESEVRLFEQLSAATIGESVLLSHATVREWDDRPVSISPTAVQRLRNANPGVLLIADDLQMAGMRQYHGLIAATRSAIASGVDLVCVGNNLRHEEDVCVRAAEELRTAVSHDETLRSLSEDAIRRVATRKAAAALAASPLRRGPDGT